MNRYNKTIYFCLGLGATSPLLALVIGGRAVSLMNIAFVFVFIDLFWGKKKYNPEFKKFRLYQEFMIWMLLSIVASVFGFVYFISFLPEYSLATILAIPKVSLYISFLFLLGKNPLGEQKSQIVMKGLKFGIALNLLWSIADASMYYIMRESLTNRVFQAYIEAKDMQYGTASIIDGISIRSVGLNNDPARIGFFATVASAYAFASRKKWIIAIGLLSSFSSVSFVGIVGIFLVSCYHIIYKDKIKIKLVHLILLFLLGSAGCFWFYSSENTFVDGIRTAVELRVESKSEGDHSMNTRKLFIEKFPKAIENMPTALVLGTGYHTAVYPYYLEGLDYGSEQYPTDMENVYVDYFFSFGLIGFAFFVMFYFHMFVKSQKYTTRKDDDMQRIVYSITLGSLISFAFYHFTIYSVIMLTSIYAILYIAPHATLPKDNVKDFAS